MSSDLNDKLKSEGWVRRFTVSQSRLQEAIENYEMLGFEVKTVPVRELDRDSCSVCFDDENDTTVMIFTRNKSANKQENIEH